jgi:hypothetical protein
MRRSPLLFFAATLLAFLWSAAHPLDADAAKKKKKKKPTPAPAASASIELDANPPAAGAPSPPPAASAPAAPPPAADATAAPEADANAKKPAAAEADDDTVTLGGRHTFVLDDLSGFRASTAGGIGYAGPIGFSTQSYNLNVFGATGAVAGYDTIHATTIWLAPSADYFLFEHISIGAILELAWNSSNYTVTTYGTQGSSASLPSTFNFTLIPRAGYLLNLAEKWALWPRVGLGFGVLQENSVSQAGGGNPQTVSSSPTFLLDVDVGVLYRLDNHFFLRAGPELTWGPGASLIDFSFAGGFGYLWGL